MPNQQDEIATLRAFNRAYTSRLGLLGTRLDQSPFTLSEARILYELATRDDRTGAELARTLQLDPAQVSRTLKRFAGRGLVATRSDPAHGRHQFVSLTRQGRAAYAALNDNTQAAVGALLDALPAGRRKRLLSSARAITRIFDGNAVAEPSLRDLRPGDLGLVTARQAILYAEEFGWNMAYEALVARILADFQQSFDRTREAGWIAEIDGEMVGSVFLMRGDAPQVGKLRLLYVESDARGAGVGKMLVSTCIERARAVGYRRLDLWTNSVLAAARSLYQRAGFVLVDEAPHHSFGKDLVGQSWSLEL